MSDGQIKEKSEELLLSDEEDDIADYASYTEEKRKIRLKNGIDIK